MIRNFTKGMLIGIANIIPGVSGGTFALILGIYDRLIQSIGKIDGKLLILIIHPKRFFEEFKKNDGIFLSVIIAGALLSIAALSWIMEYLLINHPGLTLSFFIGLIAPSIAVPYKMIENKGIRNFIYILPGISIVLFIYFFRTFVSLSQGAAFPVLFLSGVLAVSAMILPGISGSFILLIMGVYQQIISNIKSFTATFNMDSFIVLVVFGLGCVVGMVLFVRAMKFLLVRFRNKTLYFLIGMVLGSLVVLWPFKNYAELMNVDKTEISIFNAENILPDDAGTAAWYFLLIIIGLAGSYGLRKSIGGRKEEIL